MIRAVDPFLHEWSDCRGKVGVAARASGLSERRKPKQDRYAATQVPGVVASLQQTCDVLLDGSAKPR